MKKKGWSRETKTYIQLALTVLILAILVSWGAWTYYHSKGAVKHRAQSKLRDSCFDNAKYRYRIYIEQNGVKQPDGSYVITEREQIYIENLRKEEYRMCSELFPWD